MADIRDQILKQYGVDIRKEEFLKWYKVDKPDLTATELNAKIDACRKRWTQSVNGTNEAFAARDRERLAKADKYEAILRDDKLRHALFAQKNRVEAEVNVTPVAREARAFFSLVQTTKKLQVEDGRLYCDYYGLAGKGRSVITKLLTDEFHVDKRAAQAEEKKDAKEETASAQEKNSKEKDHVIVNLFSEKTVKTIGKCLRTFGEAKTYPEVVKHFPILNGTLYEAFVPKQDITYAAFREQVEQGRAASQDIYNNFDMGDGQKKLMNVLYNDLQAMLASKDVIDNFPEFLLLLKYPDLTPYMYEFVDMKPKTIDGLYDVASTEYGFRDEADFVLNYYNHVHDNFNINNEGIRAVLKKAEKSAKSNAVMNKIDSALGLKKGVKLPFGAAALHYLAYLPIYVFYVLFEIIKVLLGLFAKKPVKIGLFVALLVLANVLLPKVYGTESLLFFRRIFQPGWRDYINEEIVDVAKNWFSTLMMTLILIIWRVAIYAVPACLAYVFLSATAAELSKRMDWRGLERTFEKLSGDLKRQTKAQVSEKRAGSLVSGIVVNLVSLAALIGIIVVAMVLI